jgi:uncharacterized membrane protein YeaQ/YmgE (transglycosylase-associated protein family)
MTFLTWILLGLGAGFLGSTMLNRHGGGAIVDIIIGLLGALAGGFIFHRFGARGVTGLNLWSMMVATVGAVLLMIMYHVLIGKRIRS